MSNCLLLTLLTLFVGVLFVSEIFASASLACFDYAYFKFKMFQTPNLPLKTRSYYNPTQLTLFFNGHTTPLEWWVPRVLPVCFVAWIS